MEREITLRGCSKEEIDALVPPNTILLGYRGSIAHGMYLDPGDPNSVDDKDIMGVCIPEIDCYLGLHRFEQRESKLREWDSVVFEIRKFVGLLANSNPNVLSLLWLEPNHYILVTTPGQVLLCSRHLFVTKRIFHAFTGYAYAQLKKMEHATFEGYMGEKRKRIVETYGYDTKNAAHCIRLLRVGIEFLREGEMHVQRPDAPQLLEIKLGGWTLDRVKQEALSLFKRAETAYDESKLPVRPDMQKVNSMLVGILREHFQVKGVV